MLLPTDADDNEPASRAIALADYGLHSAVKMAQACTREGLEHIIGLRVRVAPERRVRAWGEKPSELVLLVVDEEGWANVVALCNLGWLSGYDRGPRIDLRDLSRHSDGLVCLSGAPGVGLLPRALEQVPDPTLPAEAIALARQLAAIFPDRLYLELAYHGQPLDRLVNRHVITLAQRLDLPLVATGAVRFATPADALAYTTLEAIGANKKVAGLVEARKNDLPNVALDGNRAQAWLRSPRDMARLWGQLPAALDATLDIARRCTFRLPLADGTPPEERYSPRLFFGPSRQEAESASEAH